MSMFSCAGAESAANEILALVRNKILENREKPEVLKVLKEIEEKAESIRREAEAGWY